MQYPPGTFVTDADTGDIYVARAPDMPTDDIARKLYAAGQRHRQRFGPGLLGTREWLAISVAALVGALAGLHLQPRRV